MNLANKITISRIVLTLLLIALLLFPFDELGISTYKLFVNEALVVDIKYLIAGVLFLVASLTDFLDGHIARKYKMVTDFGKMTDAIADKLLVNSVLIILAGQGMLHPVIPVVIVGRDTAVDVIKMIIGNKGHAVGAIKTGKYKTACMMVGVTLTLFYNLPFELLNVNVASIFIIIATILSVISGFQYYNMGKVYLKEK